MQPRLATRDDLPAMRAVMAAAITELQKPFLSDAEITASGYQPVERFADGRGGAPVPLLRMSKDISKPDPRRSLGSGS